MKTCTLFDKYRDGELSQAEEKTFQAHLAECADCQGKMFFLDNLAAVLKNDPIVMRDLSGQIAEKAFSLNKTWDAVLLSWLRPGPAFVALSLVCLLFSTLWILPSYQPSTNAFSEYERLMSEANAENMDSIISQIQSDAELVVWLEQEVRSQ
jgi:hypothetical protein